MKKVYAAVLTPDKSGGYSVSIPDLNIGTQGETIEECIDMARDAIGLVGISMQGTGKSIPEPLSLNPAHQSGDIVTLIDIDFAIYFSAKKEVINLTIKDMRTASGMSQSAFGNYFGIPIRTIQNWESGVRTPPDYVTELIQYKLINERIIEPED